MVDGEGRIIAISSVGCNLNSSPRIAYYAGAAKAMLEYQVRMYAKREASRRITFNTVVPGITQTPAWKNLKSPEELETFAAARCPMRTMISPSDVAEAVVWLCSNKARFITGNTFYVDGGLHFRE
jgi:NAD(P)-dependent dehydrogenase (short-subunit alcohol dehydrogenase family)